MVAKEQSPRKTEALVKDLGAALKDPERVKQPLIIQDRFSQTRTRHVVVIWDDWRSLEREARGRIIMDAYDASGLLKGDTVTVAMGLAQDEALDMGYLPYKIEPMVRKTDPVKPGDLRRAMKSVGGVQVRVGNGFQLRFPTMEHAERSCRLLSEKIPGPYWAVVQEAELSGGSG